MSGDQTSEALDAYRSIVNDIRTFHPVTGSFEAEEDYTVIKGDALGEGTWNLFYYPAKEIAEAKDSLIGEDLVIGHGKSELDEVGEVTETNWNSDRKVLEFTATVTSDSVAQMIKRGVVDSVSVGVEFDEEKEDGKRVARNLDFYELALVKEPAFTDGIKEIISEQIPEEEEERLNEMSQGGEDPMSKESKVLIHIPRKVYEELSDKDDLEIVNEYKGYYPEKYGGKGYGYYPYGYGYGYPGYGYYGYPGYKYPGKEGKYYGYGPSPLTLTFKEIFRRVDKLAEEVGVEFETKYPYPKPEYPYAQKEEESESESEEQSAVLAVEVDEEKAESIMEDLQKSISELVDEVGYPGPETEVAGILEDINERLESLENELGL